MLRRLRLWLISKLGAIPSEELSARSVTVAREQLRDRLSRYWKAINPLLEQRSADAMDTVQFDKWCISEESDIVRALVQAEHGRVDYALRMVRAEFDVCLGNVRRVLIPDAPDDAA
jgi:hypothetical protein